MKKNIILLLCVVSVLSSSAQTSTMEISTSQLVGTKWERVLPEDKGVSIFAMFTKTSLNENIHYELIAKSHSISNDYYITDEPPSYSLFHADYVGKDRKGHYIVFYYPIDKEVDYWKVVSATDDELLFFRKAKPGQIPNLDIYIKYKRIKE